MLIEYISAAGGNSLSQTRERQEDHRLSARNQDDPSNGLRGISRTIVGGASLIGMTRWGSVA